MKRSKIRKAQSVNSECRVKMENKAESIIKFNNRGYKARVLNIGDLGFVNVCSDILKFRGHVPNSQIIRYISPESVRHNVIHNYVQNRGQLI